MTDRPILFSAPMVRALLAGTKTQTRRVINTKPSWTKVNLFDGTWADSYVLDPGNQSWRDDAYPWRVGDHLYVREAFSGLWEYGDLPPREWPHPSPVHYWAEGNPIDGDWTKPKPGMHMPRWASRLTLTVTEVRVQRLQEISEEDAVAEGIEPALPGRSAVVQYLGLWDSLNADRGFGWAVNPWVVAVSFTVERRNIDEVAP